MLDVVNGQERARAWPKKRGKKLHPKVLDRMEWFRQAQWATKYMAPEMYWKAAAAVNGSPILPRDILTMMMAGRLLAFERPNGSTLWSEAVRMDVSQALDVITDAPGSLLVRGPDGWISIPAGPEGYSLQSMGEGLSPEWVASGGGGQGKGVVYGENSMGGSADGISAQYIGCKPILLPSGATISQIGFYVENAVGTSDWLVGLYDDVALRPANLIMGASTPIHGLVQGMNIAPLPAVYENTTGAPKIIWMAVGCWSTGYVVTRTVAGRIAYFHQPTPLLPAVATGVNLGNNGWDYFGLP